MTKEKLDSIMAELPPSNIPIKPRNGRQIRLTEEDKAYLRSFSGRTDISIYDYIRINNNIPSLRKQ